MRPFYTLLTLLFITTGARALTPEEILATMQNRYAQCKSYEDSGMYRNLQHASEKESTRDFKTHYLRPDKFLFEWAESGQVSAIPRPPNLVTLHRVRVNGLIWSRREGTFYLDERTFDPDEGHGGKAITTETATIGALGVSEEPAPLMLSLLLNQTHFSPRWELIELQQLRDASVNRIACYHLHGNDKSFVPMDFWIGKRDFLLRKIQRGDNVEVMSEVRIDQAIPLSIFERHPKP